MEHTPRVDKRKSQRTCWVVQTDTNVICIDNLAFDIVNTDENDLSDAVSMGHHVRSAAISCDNENDVVAMIFASEKCHVDTYLFPAAGA
jgi:hypothetical protein